MRAPFVATVRIPLVTLAALGAIALTLPAIGIALDVRDFDPTTGGFEPPYTDYTGAPIDWSRMDETATGMAKRGFVVNVLVNCTTGMLRFEIFKQAIPFRALSPRALAIHDPRRACVERGFAPEF